MPEEAPRGRAVSVEGEEMPHSMKRQGSGMIIGSGFFGKVFPVLLVALGIALLTLVVLAGGVGWGILQ